MSEPMVENNGVGEADEVAAVVPVSVDAAAPMESEGNAPAAAAAADSSVLTKQLENANAALAAAEAERDALRASNTELQQRVDSLTTSLALASNVTAASAPSGSDDSAALRSQIETLTRQLADKDAEFKKLKREFDDTTARLEISDGRLKMVEERANKQKDEEVKAITDEAQAALAKRKAQFMALREQYQAGVARIQELETAATDSQTKINDLQSTINDLRAQSASRDDEVNAIKANEASLLQRITELESSVDAEKAAASTSQANLAAAEKELDAAKLKLEQFDDKAQAQRASKCSISLEAPGADAPQPIFPTVVETGRALVFKWQMAGKVHIRWSRSFRGAAWVAIEGKSAVNPRYVPTIDDVGACLRATATAVESGESMSAEIGPVHPGIGLVAAISENLKKFDVTLNCDVANDAPGSRQRQLQLNKEKLKLRSGGKTVIKAAWGDSVRCQLEPDLTSKFSVTFEDPRVAHSFVAPNQASRDIIVATIRAFNFMLTRGGKMTAASDHVQAIALQLTVLNETLALGTPGVSEVRRPPINASASTSALGSKSNLGANAATAASPSSAAGKKEANGAAAGGGGAGSVPPTPKSTATAPSAAFNADFDDALPATGAVQRKDSQIPSRSDSGADRKQSSADAAPPAAVAAAAAAAGGGGGSSLAPPAEAKPVRKNSAGDEVDADGFVIRKANRGFDDIGAPADSDDEDGEPKGPVIKVSIRDEARPLATGESLRNLTAGLSLGGPAKGKKGGKGTLGKEKKKGRKSEGGGLGGFLDGGDDGAASGGGAAGGDDFAADFGAASTPKPSSGDASASGIDLLLGAAPVTSPSASSSTTIDLFSGLDVPAPTTASTDLFVDLFAPSSSSSSSSSSSVPVAFDIIETVNLVCEAGKVVQISVLGEVHVSLAGAAAAAPPPPSQSLQFQLSNASRIDKIQPLESCTAVDASTFTYGVSFPAGTTKYQALRYKLKHDLADSASLLRDFPLSIRPQWKIDGAQCTLDAPYSPNAPFPGSSFSQLRLMTNLEAPAIVAVKSSSFQCKASPDKQKLMWVLPNNVSGAQTLHAEIEVDPLVPVAAKPLLLSFVLDNARAPLAGTSVVAAPSSALSVGSQTVTIKSGQTCSFA